MMDFAPLSTSLLTLSMAVPLSRRKLGTLLGFEITMLQLSPVSEQGMIDAPRKLSILSVPEGGKAIAGGVT